MTVTSTQMAAIFLGGLLGYWAVSALIESVRKRAKSAADEAAISPSVAHAPDPLPSKEAQKPSRSVWEEMNGGGS
jgi:hypothetical protein